MNNLNNTSDAAPIILMHGPVIDVERVGNTAAYTLDDGSRYEIEFSVGPDGIRRTVRTDGHTYTDMADFGPNFTIDDYMQWTADNWCEIEELVSWTR